MSLRFLVIFLISICSFQSVLSQYATSAAGGEWTDGAFWGGAAPPYTGVAQDVTINHRIYSNQSIVFASGGGDKDAITINDTLIIYGSLTLGLDDDINVGASAVVIIFGDFTAVNKVSVDNGGYFVVLGDFTMTGGAGTDYDNSGGGQTFVTGTVDVSGVGGGGIPALDCDPNVDVGCGYGDGSDLFDDPIFDFIDEISGESCNVTVTASIIDDSGAGDGSIDVTVSGATAPSYSWDNDSITQDISGLASGVYSLVVFDGTCVVDTSFTVGGACTPPTPTFTAEVTSACIGSTGNVYTTEAGMTNYVWAVSAGGTITAGGAGTDNSVTVTWNTAGPQTVSVNYENPVGCAGASATVSNVTVNALPTITTSATPATICYGEFSDLNATGGTSYSWSPAGDLDNAAIATPRYTPASNPTTPSQITTTFTVTVTDANSCVNTNTVDVVVNRLPETGPQHHIENSWGM